jgi:hypothetical protein
MEYNLFMGGQAGNTTNRLVPSGSPESILGYADHQRSRDYAVTRQLDFRPNKPWGGADITVPCKDYEWYRALVAAGGDLIVGDILNVIALTPNSRLEYVSVNVVIPKTGLGFSVIQRINADPGTPATSTVAAPAAATGYLAATGLGATAGIYTSVRSAEATASRPKHSFISLEITAVPTVTPPAGKLDGLFVIVQAEVIDWGSYDFNGNA